MFTCVKKSRPKHTATALLDAHPNLHVQRMLLNSWTVWKCLEYGYVSLFPEFLKNCEYLSWASDIQHLNIFGRSMAPRWMCIQTNPSRHMCLVQLLPCVRIKSIDRFRLRNKMTPASTELVAIRGSSLYFATTSSSMDRLDGCKIGSTATYSRDESKLL